MHHDARGVEHAPQRWPQALARPRDEVRVVRRAGEEPSARRSASSARATDVASRSTDGSSRSRLRTRGAGTRTCFGCYDRRRSRRRPRGALHACAALTASPRGTDGKRCIRAARRQRPPSRVPRVHKARVFRNTLCSLRASNVGPTPVQTWGRPTFDRAGPAQGVAKRTRTAKGLPPVARRRVRTRGRRVRSGHRRDAARRLHRRTPVLSA